MYVIIFTSKGSTAVAGNRKCYALTRLVSERMHKWHKHKNKSSGQLCIFNKLTLINPNASPNGLSICSKCIITFTSKGSTTAAGNRKCYALTRPVLEASWHNKKMIRKHYKMGKRRTNSAGKTNALSVKIIRNKRK